MLTRQYVQFNISKKSNAAIEYVLKFSANIMETILFLFMGLSVLQGYDSWNTGFVLMAVVCCTLYRFLGVFLFTYIANKGRLIKLEFSDMMIMSYCGLRGGMAFALALVLDANKIPRKNEFVTATIFIVLFTIFVQVISFSLDFALISVCLY
jgi:NhaP-type Na+/H+ or K+/H+ antiporter